MIFALVYLVTQMTFKLFFPDRYGPDKEVTGIMLRPVDDTVKGQHHPILSIRNKTDKDFALINRCPMPPVDVWKVEGATPTQLIANGTALPCKYPGVVLAGETVQIDLGPWKYSLFSEYGDYVVALPEVEGAPEGSQLEAEFNIYEAGVMTQVFRTFITKPLLNLLIFIASITPGYSLGIAIIIVTILVKLLLFVPTQHAMEGQRKMQAIQPKMDALKAKHKDNPQKLQEETMKIWKENKVNPMQSCLPMLIQFPILIGLFFTIRDGSVLALSQHLLYAPYQDLSWTFGMQFLGLDLAKPNVYILPPMLMIMQFYQMKLSFAINKKKQEKSGVKKKDGEKATQQEMQQKMMQYGLPLMIGFFAIRFPAAVSLYWGVSTVFAIFQQLYVNRKE
ncbi:MAG: YidC/Oxa1 family membrane protein insertase [Candidatus Peribacteraceae bacterium]|nr:YidC/Oxa1 family membrane protein insertase [Candidatus Peribacteraceae bacterium]